MKRLVLVLLLAVVLSVSAFAEHPEGWGAGFGYQFGGLWESPGTVNQGLTLYLKAPEFPIHFGLSLGLDTSTFRFSVTGDYYVLDKTLSSDIGLGWFVGVGGYFRVTTSKDDYIGVDLGARLPVGLYWMPLDFLEIFFDIAPSVGLFAHFNPVKIGLGGGWQGEIAVRFWF